MWCDKHEIPVFGGDLLCGPMYEVYYSPVAKHVVFSRAGQYFSVQVIFSYRKVIGRGPELSKAQRAALGRRSWTRRTGPKADHMINTRITQTQVPIGAQARTGIDERRAWSEAGACEPANLFRCLAEGNSFHYCFHSVIK